MKNTLLFLAVFLAVGLADEVFTDMMKRHEPIVSTNKWAFSVAPKQEGLFCDIFLFFPFSLSGLTLLQPTETLTLMLSNFLTIILSVFPSQDFLLENSRKFY